MKNNGCVGCHQLGQAATRTIPKAFGEFKTGEDAWMRRTQSGQAGELMVEHPRRPARRRALQVFRRLDRPRSPRASCRTPSRRGRPASSATSSSPPGIGPTRSTISTTSPSRDKRNPTVNAYGPVFGQPEYSTDRIPILDPVANTVDIFKAPVRDANMPMSLGPGHAAMLKPLAALGLLGRRADLGHPDQQPQLDDRREGPDVARGRRPRRRRIPTFCKKGSDHPSAKVFPLDRKPSRSSRCSIRRR